MKIVYKISLSIITLLFAVLLYHFICLKIDVSEILQLSAIFVALFSSVLAISISDKKKNQIDFSLHIFGHHAKGKSDYVRSELDSSIQNHFEKNGEFFSSYKVYFEIRNKSEFNLKRPTITMKIPSKLKHPTEDKKSIEFRSNIFNSASSFQMLEYEETTVMSNTNLPFLHKNEVIKIWIRMLLDPSDENTLTFHFALDSDNLEGKNEIIYISPKEILERIGK